MHAKGLVPHRIALRGEVCEVALWASLHYEAVLNTPPANPPGSTCTSSAYLLVHGTREAMLMARLDHHARVRGLGAVIVRVHRCEVPSTQDRNVEAVGHLAVFEARASFKVTVGDKRGESVDIEEAIVHLGGVVA